MDTSTEKGLRKRPTCKGDDFSTSTDNNRSRQLSTPEWTHTATRGHPLYPVMGGMVEAKRPEGPTALDITRAQCVACARKLIDPCSRHSVKLYHEDYGYWQEKDEQGSRGRKGRSLHRAVQSQHRLTADSNRFVSQTHARLGKSSDWNSDTSTSSFFVAETEVIEDRRLHRRRSSANLDVSRRLPKSSSRQHRHRFICCLSLVSILFLITFSSALVAITISAEDWTADAPVSTLSVASEVYRHLWSLDEAMFHPLLSLYDQGMWGDLTARFAFARDYLSFTLGTSIVISKKGYQVWLGSSSGTFVSLVMTGTDLLERYTMSPAQVRRQQLVRQVVFLDKARGTMSIRSTEELTQEAFVVNKQSWFTSDRPAVPRNGSQERPWDHVDIALSLPWYEEAVAYNCITLQHAIGGKERLRLCAGLPLAHVHEVITDFVRTGGVQHAFYLVESGRIISSQSGILNESAMVVSSVAEFNARNKLSSGLSEVLQRISEVTYSGDNTRCLYDPDVEAGHESEHTLLIAQTGRGTTLTQSDLMFVGTCIRWHNNNFGVIQFAPRDSHGSDSLSFHAVVIGLGVIVIVAVSSKIGGTIVLLLEDYEHRLERLDNDSQAVLGPRRKETFSEFTEAIEPYAAIQQAVARANEFMDPDMVRALRQAGQFGILGLHRRNVSLVCVFAETDLMISKWPECRRFVSSLNGIFDTAAERSDEALFHFNALTECPHHCANALSFAMELQRHLGHCKKAYVYVSTGTCFVGNVGMTKEMRFSIVGPASSSISEIQNRARRSLYDGPLTLLVSQDAVYALDNAGYDYSWRQWDGDDDVFTLDPDNERRTFT